MERGAGTDQHCGEPPKSCNKIRRERRSQKVKGFATSSTARVPQMNDGRSGYSRVVLGVFACPLGERRGSNGGRLCLRNACRSLGESTRSGVTTLSTRQVCFFNFFDCRGLLYVSIGLPLDRNKKNSLQRLLLNVTLFQSFVGDLRVVVGCT